MLKDEPMGVPVQPSGTNLYIKPFNEMPGKNGITNYEILTLKKNGREIMFRNNKSNFFIAERNTCYNSQLYFTISRSFEIVLFGFFFEHFHICKDQPNILRNTFPYSTILMRTSITIKSSLVGTSQMSPQKLRSL